MRLLDRYLLRELLIPLGYCLGGFVLLIVFFDLFAQLNHFQSVKLRIADIAEYYLVSLPSTLALVLPILCHPPRTSPFRSDGCVMRRRCSRH